MIQNSACGDQCRQWIPVSTLLYTRDVTHCSSDNILLSIFFKWYQRVGKTQSGVEVPRQVCLSLFPLYKNQFMSDWGHIVSVWCHSMSKWLQGHPESHAFAAQQQKLAWNLKFSRLDKLEGFLVLRLLRAYNWLFRLRLSNHLRGGLDLLPCQSLEYIKKITS